MGSKKKKKKRGKKERKVDWFGVEIAGEPKRIAAYGGLPAVEEFPTEWQEEKETFIALEKLRQEGRFGVDASDIAADEVGNILFERGEAYGEAWKITGTIIQDLNVVKMIMSGRFYAWLMILSKLIRLLTTPDHSDSWLDIEGFARLAREDIQKADDHT